MKRFSGIMFLAAWLAAVAWYWHGNVPLAATASAKRPPNAHVRGLAPSGQLMLTYSRFTNGPDSVVVSCGPLEFWEFPACRKVRQLFSENDQIIDGPLPHSRELLIRRDGRLLVVSSDSGETVGALPDIPGAARFTMIPGESHVLIEDKFDLHLYELDGDLPIWTATSMALRGPPLGDPIAAGLVSVSLKMQRGRYLTTSGGGVLRLDTGELDTRFDHLGKFGRVRISPNGRYVLVWVNGSLATMTPGKIVVCDAATGALLWTLPPPIDSLNGPIFDGDGDEIRGLEMTPGKVLQPVRWRSADGARLPQQNPPDFTRLRPQSFDGRFFWRFPRQDGHSLLARAVNQINNFASRFSRFHIRSQPQMPELIDTQTGRVLGLLPPDGAHYFLPDQPALVTADFTDIHYFALPPIRNYWWLAGWSLIPPSLLIAFSRLVRSVSRRTSLMAATTPVNGP